MVDLQSTALATWLRSRCTRLSGETLYSIQFSFLWREVLPEIRNRRIWLDINLGKLCGQQTTCSIGRPSSPGLALYPFYPVDEISSRVRLASHPKLAEILAAS